MATVAGASKRQIGMLFDICREHKIEIVFNFRCKIIKSNLFHWQCSAPLCGPSCEENSPHKQVFNTLARSNDLSIFCSISILWSFQQTFPRSAQCSPNMELGKSCPRTRTSCGWSLPFVLFSFLLMTPHGKKDKTKMALIRNTLRPIINELCSSRYKKCRGLSTNMEARKEQADFLGTQARARFSLFAAILVPYRFCAASSWVCSPVWPQRKKCSRCSAS